MTVYLHLALWFFGIPLARPEALARMEAALLQALKDEAELSEPWREAA